MELFKHSSVRDWKSFVQGPVLWTSLVLLIGSSFVDPAIHNFNNNNNVQQCDGGSSGSTVNWPTLKLNNSTKSFYIGHFFKANWYKAFNYCTYHGMRLLSVNNLYENNFIEKTVQEFGLGNEHFWTSGNDLGEESVFHWFGTGSPLTFTNWNAGEPNNFKYENGEEENCLELWNRDGKGLKWNDTPCSFETYFICEK